MKAYNDTSREVLHWYDFLCPFCYVGQRRTEILVRRGMHVIELPFRAHPEIPPGGIPAWPREGKIYALLEREARSAELPLRWLRHLPDTQRALAAAEWVRRNRPCAFSRLYKCFFNAHFVLGENLEDPAVIERHAIESGVDVVALNAALAGDGAAAAVREPESVGRACGVRGPPAWLVGRRLIEGLRPASEFERIADCAGRISR